jgi:hypothetical protein
MSMNTTNDYEDRNSPVNSDVVASLYTMAWMRPEISFLAWNIGEALGVLDRYYRRKWLSREGHDRLEKHELKSST